MDYAIEKLGLHCFC